MAGKILLAVAAALCSFAALNATPILDPLLRDVHVNELVHDLDADALRELQLQLKWLNATKILEDIERLLGTVEQKIDDVSDEVGSAITSILIAIENAALKAAGKWNATLQRWVDEANKVGVDVSSCLDEGKRRLAVVEQGLREDAQDCVSGHVADLTEALANVKALGPEARALFAEAKEQVAKCLSEGNILSDSLCLATSLPTLTVKESALVVKAVYLASLATAKVSTVVPLTSLCVTRVSTGRAAEASAVTNDVITCIRNSLP